jgi:[1-hydroxy-2-(trimethylamino)ethyl]phosphonate dioxygenase
MTSNAIETIVRVFQDRGSGRYGDECVSQLEHAIQAALLAQQADADPSLVAAALLHDLGHIIGDSDLPESDDEDLNDFHEEKAYQWLLSHFGPSVADPVRLHVAAKRYLCTKEPEYANTLSPTSLKSFHDQGGVMSSDEVADFESEPYYREALTLRRWDDLAKEENKLIPSIESFVPLLQMCADKVTA